MCEQKCYPNGKVRETLSYLSEDWYTRMVLCKDVNEIEITGGLCGHKRKKKKFCKVLQIWTVATSQSHVNFILILNRNSIYLLPSSSIRGLEVLSICMHSTLCKMCISYFWSARSFLFHVSCHGEVSECKVNGKNR